MKKAVLLALVLAIYSGAAWSARIDYWVIDDGSASLKILQQLDAEGVSLESLLAVPPTPALTWNDVQKIGTLFMFETAPWGCFDDAAPNNWQVILDGQGKNWSGANVSFTVNNSLTARTVPHAVIGGQNYFFNTDPDGPAKLVAYLHGNPINLNDFGEYEFSLSGITPIVKPTITTHPVSQIVAQGASVTFSVVATGTLPLVYQWKKDGANVGANSPDLVIASVANADAGSYTCIVSNLAGSATSNAAILTVTEPPGRGEINITHGEDTNLLIAINITGDIEDVIPGISDVSQIKRLGASYVVWDDASLSERQVHSSQEVVITGWPMTIQIPSFGRPAMQMKLFAIDQNREVHYFSMANCRGVLEALPPFFEGGELQLVNGFWQLQLPAQPLPWGNVWWLTIAIIAAALFAIRRTRKLSTN
ncbi:MAG: immunoglobulin domain-containing protein [Patescibacteria group bacterium]